MYNKIFIVSVPSFRQISQRPRRREKRLYWGDLVDGIIYKDYLQGKGKPKLRASNTPRSDGVREEQQLPHPEKAQLSLAMREDPHEQILKLQVKSIYEPIPTGSLKEREAAWCSGCCGSTEQEGENREWIGKAEANRIFSMFRVPLNVFLIPSPQRHFPEPLI